MFVQVIEGRTSDAAGMRARLEEWEKTLGPGATGWLGATAGVTASGNSVSVVRFESEEAARANSDRPEQGEWWSRMEPLYDGDPSFVNCPLVEVTTHSGEPDDAGFVQVMRGRSRDVEQARQLMADHPVDFSDYRPEILATLWAGNPDGEWSMTVYFTSEDAAREGEQKPPPPEMVEVMEQLNALEEQEPRFLDLQDFWLSSPS